MDNYYIFLNKIVKHNQGLVNDYYNILINIVKHSVIDNWAYFRTDFAM